MAEKQKVRSTSKAGQTRSTGKTGHSNNGRGSISAIEAVRSGRDQLAEMLGRPVEAVLGVERDSSNWVLRAQVLELERIPNTTDVLGEYEAVLDRKGELVSYSRRHRYHRGHVDDER